MLRRLLERLLGRRCKNHAFGCPRRTKLPHGYCAWCWERSLFTERQFRAWVEN